MTDPTITIAGLRAQVATLIDHLDSANTSRGEFSSLYSQHSAKVAAAEAERDALAAQLTEVRAELAKAPKVCAIHSYALEGPCMTCGAPWPGAEKALRQERIEGMEKMRRISAAVGCPNSVEEVVEAVAAIKSDLASERAHLAACQTRIAGLERAADERSAEVARLEARPVLTVERLTEAWCCAGAEIGMPNRSYVADLAGRAMRHLGLVTLLTAQDDPMRHHESRDYALQSPANGYWPADVGAVNGTEALAMGAMLRSVGPHPISDAALLAMARAAIECVDKLNAPPTSPPAARPVFAGVSEDELIRLFYVVGTDGIDHGENCPPIDSSDRSGIRAVLARLEVSLVAPGELSSVANELLCRDGGGLSVAELVGKSLSVIAERRAAGIPVTPEVGK